MTASARSTARLAMSLSQNTAPVTEFRCLFTHDLRRKQKRWQDGYLKFHTFNNRVMVYDTARNFLGDTYHKDSNEIHEGDELTLDKGIMVEVADAVGVTQTDLTPILEKKHSPHQKAAVPRPALQPATSNVVQRTVASNLAARNVSHLRHKSLNSLLGKKRAPIGKVDPHPKSPYEARKEREEKEHEWEQGRAVKRQKTDRTAVEAALPGAGFAEQQVLERNTALVPLKTIPTKPIPAKRTIAREPIYPKPAEIINLDSDTDHLFSDVTLPDTPRRPERPVPHIREEPIPKVIASKPIQHVVTEKPMRQVVQEKPTPRMTEKVISKVTEESIPRAAQAPPSLPKGRIPLPHLQPETPRRLPPRSSSPPVSVSNRLSNVNFALELESIDKSAKEPPSPKSPPRDSKAKSLRLKSRGRIRGTLLCQTLPQQRSKTASEPQGDVSRSLKEKDSREEAGFEIQWPSDEEAVGQNKLAKLHKETVKPAPVRTSSKTSTVRTRTKSTASKDRPRDPSPSQSSSDAFEDVEIAYGRMGQRLLAKTATRTKGNSLQRRVDPPTVKAIRPSNPPPVNPYPEQPKPPSPPTIRAAKPNQKPTRPSPLLLRQAPRLVQQVANDPIDSSQQGQNKMGVDSESTRLFQRIRPQNGAPIPSSVEDWERRNLPPQLHSEPTPRIGVSGGISKRMGGFVSVSGRIPKNTDPRRKFQKSRSLKLGANSGDGRTGAGGVRLLEGIMGTESEMNLKVDTDVGPWSMEAFDLFDWRPPGREGPGDGGEKRGREC